MVTFEHGAAVLPPMAVAVPVIGACVLLVAGRRAPRAVTDGSAMTLTAATTALLGLILATSLGGRVVTWSGHWVPHRGYSVGIVLVSDPVGAGAALVAGCLMLLALLFSARYIEGVEAHFHCLMLLFLAGMVGLALTADLFDMFCFFELMGAAAYGLTGMKIEDQSALQGALNFGIVNSLGAYVSLMGIGLLFARTGNLGLPQLGADLAHHHADGLVVAGFALVMTGFLVKAAMVPFHFWLADAHAVAPTPVCVLFSGIMVPLGVYAAFRIYWVVFSGSLPHSGVNHAFLVLGAVTALLGAVMALAQRHVKRLLAFSTVAHVGLFLLALGLLTKDGTAGAIIYVVGHAGVKAALFLVAGITLNLYGSVDERRLHGAGTGRRWLGWLMIAGGVALAGLPPFGTALGKTVSEEAGISAGHLWIPAVFVVVSALTGAAVLRVAARVFFGLGQARTEEQEGDESTGEEEREARLDHVPWSMAVPPVVLLAGALAAGVLPGAHAVADRAAAYFTDASSYIRQALHHTSLPAPSGSADDWTTEGVLLGVLSTALAAGVAGVALYGRQWLERLPASSAGRWTVHLLHRVHSGHVGDYVAWLVVGTVVLAAFVGLPVR